MEVEMDVSGVHHHHHQQEMCSETLEICTKAHEEIKRPKPEEALKCPRCDSINTKFCYYNNYSLTQPRYFCKSCRRYWTKGGTLRNVPVGGGCRKNKRSSSSSPPNSSSSNINGHQDHHLINVTSNPMLSGRAHLPYGHLGFDHFGQTENFMGFNNPSSNYTPTNPQGDSLGFLENTHNGFHSVLYNNGGNIGNGDMGIVGNGGILMGLTNNSQSQNLDQEILNTSFHHHQEHYKNNSSANGGASMAIVKQERICHGRSEIGEDKGSGGVLWGFPWQIGGGDEGNEVGSVRSQINGWNGVGSTTWHGLLNSPLMY